MCAVAEVRELAQHLVADEVHREGPDVERADAEAEAHGHDIRRERERAEHSIERERRVEYLEEQEPGEPRGAAERCVRVMPALDQSADAVHDLEGDDACQAGEHRDPSMRRRHHARGGGEAESGHHDGRAGCCAQPLQRALEHADPVSAARRVGQESQAE